MSIPAPQARLGAMAALSEADNLCAEIDGLRELQVRVQELEAERDAYRESANDLGIVLQSAFADIAVVKAERDDLAERLHDLDEAHGVTLGWLAEAEAQLKRMQATR